MGKRAVCFPARDFNLVHTVGFSREYEHKRITALWEIITGEFDAVFTDIEALTQKTVSAAALKRSAKTLEPGNMIDLPAFTRYLVEIGYEATEQVDGVGQFSHRGGIIDLFTPGEERPVRIELWGDEIDTITYFDSDSQRRLDGVESITLLPAAEFVTDTSAMVDILESLLANKKVKSTAFKESVGKDLDILKSGGNISADRYMDYLVEPAGFVTDYFKDSIMVLGESRNLLSRLKSLEELRKAELEDCFEAGICDSSSKGFWADTGKLSV